MADMPASVRRLASLFEGRSAVKARGTPAYPPRNDLSDGEERPASLTSTANGTSCTSKSSAAPAALGAGQRPTPDPTNPLPQPASSDGCDSEDHDECGTASQLWSALPPPPPPQAARPEAVPEPQRPRSPLLVSALDRKWLGSSADDIHSIVHAKQGAMSPASAAGDPRAGGARGRGGAGAHSPRARPIWELSNRSDASYSDDDDSAAVDEEPGAARPSLSPTQSGSLDSGDPQAGADCGAWLASACAGGEAGGDTCAARIVDGGMDGAAPAAGAAHAEEDCAVAAVKQLAALAGEADGDADDITWLSPLASPTAAAAAAAAVAAAQGGAQGGALETARDAADSAAAAAAAEVEAAAAAAESAAATGVAAERPLTAQERGATAGAAPPDELYETPSVPLSLTDFAALGAAPGEGDADADAAAPQPPPFRSFTRPRRLLAPRGAAGAATAAAVVAAAAVAVEWELPSESSADPPGGQPPSTGAAAAAGAAVGSGTGGSGGGVPPGPTGSAACLSYCASSSSSSECGDEAGARADMPAHDSGAASGARSGVSSGAGAEGACPQEPHTPRAALQLADFGGVQPAPAALREAARAGVRLPLHGTAAPADAGWGGAASPTPPLLLLNMPHGMREHARAGAPPAASSDMGEEVSAAAAAAPADARAAAASPLVNQAPASPAGRRDADAPRGAAAAVGAAAASAQAVPAWHDGAGVAGGAAAAAKMAAGVPPHRRLLVTYYTGDERRCLPPGYNPLAAPRWCSADVGPGDDEWADDPADPLIGAKALELRDEGVLIQAATELRLAMEAAAYEQRARQAAMACEYQALCAAEAAAEHALMVAEAEAEQRRVREAIAHRAAAQCAAKEQRRAEAEAAARARISAASAALAAAAAESDNELLVPPPPLPPLRTQYRPPMPPLAESELESQPSRLSRGAAGSYPAPAHSQQQRTAQVPARASSAAALRAAEGDAAACSPPKPKRSLASKLSRFFSIAFKKPAHSIGAAVAAAKAGSAAAGGGSGKSFNTRRRSGKLDALALV